ncbi:MAG: FtsX-like permease family protein [Ruminococcus sp.]
MRKGFFARLAVVNIRKNKQIYVPYILACLFNVAMLYMMLFINHNAGMKTIRHSGDVLMITTMGVGVIVIFSFIFLLYSNSFLMKRRQKELGLYNILGLEKKHISRVMMLENLFSALISFVGGILVGILEASWRFCCS